MRCTFDKGIYVADNLKTPFVIPKIYLPVGLGDRERQYVLLHKRTPIKWGDHIIKAIAYLVLHIRWFNPLAWTAFVFMGQDIEMSCHGHVMKRLGKKARGDYVMSLLQMAAGPHIPLQGSPQAFSEGCTKERVKRVLSFKEPFTMATVVAVGRSRLQPAW